VAAADSVLTGKGKSMPILPLDHPEPFAATLGVMLYPATDPDDPPKARAFAAHWLAEPLRRFDQDGHRLSYETLLRIATDGGCPLTDFDDRCWGGVAIGEWFAMLFMLAAHDHAQNQALASWSNALRIVELIAGSGAVKGCRTKLWETKNRFLSVAHLWGALALREYRFITNPEVDYYGYDELLSFLTEAEILRDFGQQWRPRRAKSEPPLPSDVWRVPDSWNPPMRQSHWPETGKIRIREPPPEVLAKIRPAGRPRRG
jgi:hypothetical protein